MIKPINVIYELLLWNILWHGYLYAYKIHLFDKALAEVLDFYVIYGVFFACIISITTRIYFTKEDERRFISVFSFSFFVGSILWLEYSLVEFKGIGMVVSLKSISSIIFGVLSFGAIAGLAGSVVSYFIAIILRKFTN